MTSTPVRFVRGSVEYLSVTVTADVELDEQPVELSVNRGATWLPCTWQGSAGLSRVARTTNPVTFDGSVASSSVVWVRLTDVPEVPVMRAGVVTVQ